MMYSLIFLRTTKRAW